MSELPTNHTAEGLAIGDLKKRTIVVQIFLCVIILGILAAIAVPRFLNTVNKEKIAEAKRHVGAMNRRQLVHFRQKQKLAASFEALQTGFPAQTDSYTYAIAMQPDRMNVIITALPVAKSFNYLFMKPSTLLYYTGIVSIVEDPSTSTKTAVTKLCESSQPPDLELLHFNPATKTIDCPPNSTLL